jgi:hypothetical protein
MTNMYVLYPYTFPINTKKNVSAQIHSYFAAGRLPFVLLKEAALLFDIDVRKL